MKDRIDEPAGGCDVDDDSTVDEGRLSDAIVALAEAKAAEVEAHAAVKRARARAVALRAVTSPSAPPEGVDAAATPDGLPSMRRRTRVTWSRVALGAGVLTICGALAATGLMLRDHHQADAQRLRDAAFTAAAREGVEALLSIDFADARAGVQRVIDSSTGSFREEFVAGADDFIRAAEDSKAVSTGTVNAAAVDTASGDSATVALSATSEVSNDGGAKQGPRNWRMVVTVRTDGDRLKISDVKFVS